MQNKIKNLLVVVSFLVFFSHCSTAPTTPQAPKIEEPRKIEIDYVALQTQLGVESLADKVGYQDKVFDACEFAEILPPLKDCHHAYFVLAEFQLSCRGTEESSSILTAADLQPVTNKALKWRSGKNHGEVQTDQGGFAKIRAIAERSMKRQELRVSTGKDFLVIVAGQSTNIVTPPSWCE